jgi:hypothetical protein
VSKTATAICGECARFRQWSDAGCDRQYSKGSLEKQKKAMLICTLPDSLLVAIEHSVVPARMRNTEAPRRSLSYPRGSVALTDRVREE